MAENRKTLNFAANMAKLREQNKAVEEQQEIEKTDQQPSVGERVAQVRGNVGRKPKERKIRRDYPKTIYFDEPTSMKLSDVRTKDKIEIKDLVLVATIEFLNRNFNNETRSLNEAAKNYIRKEMDRILDSFSE